MLSWSAGCSTKPTSIPKSSIAFASWSPNARLDRPRRNRRQLVGREGDGHDDLLVRVAADLPDALDAMDRRRRVSDDLWRAAGRRIASFGVARCALLWIRHHLFGVARRGAAFWADLAITCGCRGRRVAGRRSVVERRHD